MHAAQSVAEGMASLASAATEGPDAQCRLECDEEMSDSCTSQLPPRALQQTSQCA